MIWLSEKARIRVNTKEGSVKRNDKYTSVNASSSRNNEGEWVYSDWSFIRFVGKAHEKAKSLGLKTGDVVILTKAAISHESYMKDEVRTWGAPQIVVFDFELYQKSGAKATESDEEPDWLK